MRITLPSTLSIAALLAAAAAGCTVKKAEAPPSSGPSELATSVTLVASPDVLPQDGASQSQVTVHARDANAQPVRALPVHLEIVVNGVAQDFGRLSEKRVVTGGDGRATVTYTAPPSLDSVDRQTMVSIIVTPAGSDAAAQLPRAVQIRLVPPGIITPPGPRVPDFTIAPNPALLLETVVFSAADPALDGQLTSYAWDFGNGSTASGRIVQHQFRNPGSFAVTLTVTDTTGARSSRTKSVLVEQGDAPTAAFVYSPAAPVVDTDIFFNASASTAAPGRRIVTYQWDFGKGTTGTGMVISKQYDVAGTYNVTLTVTDDAGVKGVVTQPVTVAP